jgi:hypothetical protein
MWGALVAVSGMALACEGLPRNPGEFTIQPGQKRSPEQAGYNGTIQDIPTSIDPRTPETDGTPGRSLAVDLGMQRMEGTGSGTGGMAEDAAIYGGSGEAGSAQGPTRESPSGSPHTDGQEPDARTDAPEQQQQSGKQQRSGGK